ncbi:MAG: hypothetical protein ING21_08410 [Burkholderiales bacterium]|nr:hypothetical protein [Rhodocyclaceae bacterium]MCA3166508.1 hypothetical protein [Burkholderiales bacterium]
MKNFGEDPFGSGGFSQRYNGLTNSCIDFTWKALEKGGLNPSGFQGDIWPTDNIDDVNNIGNPTTPPGSTGGGDPFTGLPWPGGDPGGRTGGGAGGSGGGGGAAGGTGGAGGGAGAGGTTPPRRDPLVLDLDGDGIETTSTRDGTVILFDHDADGVKTGTGWVKPDDGWLVLDRNGNGTIDSGRELFGVDTLKSNGQLATDGFDALKDLDANQDGKIDATDSVFASLRIWRDLNQDGISQANELTTLAANSITGIGVNSSAVRTDLGNGNVQTAAGSFTRSNGTTGTTGETNGAAANLDLLVNTFYRTFTTQITLTDQAKALPTLRGSGRVRDLNEAVSLSTDLGNWVQTYTQQTTRQGQSDKLDGFIEKWANTADLKSLKAQADALTGSGVNLTYSLAGLTAGTPAYDDFVRKLGVIERFMGFTYGGANGQARFTPLDAGSGNLTVSLAAEQIASISLAYDRFKTDIYESLVSETRLKSYSKLLLEDSQSASEFASLENAFKQAITLNSQQGIIDLVEFISSVGEARLAKSGWGSMGFLVAQLNAAPDLGAFSEELSSWTVRLAASTEHNLTGTSRPDLIVGSAGDDNIQGFDGNDILLGKGGNDAIDGGNGDDVILGGAGNDSLSGGAGVDRLEGGDGNDLIQGGVGDDLIDGGAGNDILAGGVYDTWNGNYNGAGNDTYRFGRGSGQDIIRDIDSVVSNRDVIELGTGISQADVKLTRSASGDLVLTVANSTDTLTINSYFDSLDAGAGAIEVLKFADGSTWDVARMKTEVQKATSGNDYLVGYGATNDTFLAGAGDDQIYGRDGNDNLDGQDGNDAVYGEAGDDTVSGGNGNDSLYGGDGNDIINGGNGDDGLVGENGADTLNGDAGNDVLQGGAGNDTLNGGAGNDILAGGVYDTWNGNYNGAGNDTYQFGRGDGQDTIIDDDATVGNLDKLVFKTGVAVADVQAVRDGDALILKINGTTDQVRIDSYFSNDGVNNRQIEEIRFTDSATTVWKLADIKAKVLTGTAGNDTIIGYATADTISGADGNDSLYGRDGNDIINGGNGDDGLVGENGDDKLNGDAGNDVLQGGAGNDILNGGAGNDILAGGVYDTWNGNYNGAGNDTYQFGRGDGQDRIVDVDATAGNVDVLSVGAGVAANQLWFRQVGSDLEVSIIGGTDKSTISNWYSGSTYHVEQFKTSDGKMLLDSQVDALVSAMAAFAPPAAGQTTLPSDYQTALNPVIAANWK